MRLTARNRVPELQGPERVIQALELARRSMRRCRVSSILAALGLIELTLALLVIGADLVWVLPTWVRGLGSLTILGSAIAVFFGRVLVPRWRFEKSDAAIEVEATFPELGQRVRTTLEYAEPSRSTAPAFPSLIKALADETDRQSQGLDFPDFVPWSRFYRRAIGLTVGFVGVLIAWVFLPEFRIASARLLLRPVHYTGLVVEPGDRTIKVGSEFVLRTTISGRPVSQVRWLRRPSGRPSSWEETSMVPPIGPAGRSRPVIGQLETSKQDCRESFEYRVVAGEVDSDLFRVTVIHPLKVQAFEASVEPPAYTRLSPSVVKQGDFRVPEGSKVRFSIGLDRGPESARLTWSPVEGEGTRSPVTIPLTIKDRTLTGELPPLARTIRYEVLASATDGMKLEDARFEIQVKPDEKPSIRFLEPDESSAETATTEVPFHVEASDDYGVSRFGISFRINDGPEQSLYLDESKAWLTSVKALTTLYLENYKLSYTDSLTYHAFVEDNRQPDPQRTVSDLRYIDIIPYKQAFELAEGSGGASDGSSMTLEELIARQRQGLNRAFAHREDRPVAPELADRLSKSEAELALVTEEFAQGLASEFGPINPLEEAVRLMGGATVALESREIVSAVGLEQSALASLIQARQNLRKILKESRSSSKARQIDRQQRQKLRKPPAKPDEMAQLEADIRKLARDQKAFAEELESPPPAKPDSADRQQTASKEADRLKGLVRRDPSLTDLARTRMDEAASSVQQAAEDSKANRPTEAAEAARLAAGQLDRLADQVAGLKSKELAQKLAKARDLAQATARAERASAGADPPETSARQLGRAEDVKTLADLLKKSASEASEEDPKLARAITKATEANSPVAIEQALRRLDPSKNPAIAGQLEALALDLEAVRRDLVQPGLEKLLAAERQAAEAQKALDNVADATQKAEAEKAVSDLARTIDGLGPNDSPLQEAASELDRATQNRTGSTGWTPPSRTGPRPGFQTPPTSYTNAVRSTSRALQTRIQELILNDSLVDRDGAVPPGYKELVERYFRILSEDLR